MRHGGFLRTSHEQRRRSCTVTLQPPLADGADPYRRRSSTSSLHDPTVGGTTERRPSYTDLSGSNCLNPSPAGSRRGSSCLATPVPLRRRSFSERPPLAKRFSSVNFELKQSRVIATIFIICSCCVMVAVLSYVFKRYVDKSPANWKNYWHLYWIESLLNKPGPQTLHRVWLSSTEQEISAIIKERSFKDGTMIRIF